MRYTTIIDIRDSPAIYRNIHARLLYLHMTLTAGYHDDDRDQCRISIRRLALETGLTISATRHSLAILQKAGLIQKIESYYLVKKFILEKTITPRIRSEKKRQQIVNQERENQLRREQEAREKEEKRRYLEERKKGDPRKQYVLELIARMEAGDEEAAETLRTSLVYKPIYQQILQEKNHG